MSDRHLRRSGSDYVSALLGLLPQGQAWPKQPGSTLERACTGLSLFWGFVDSRAADLLERESDPRAATDSSYPPDAWNPDGRQDGLLDDWERNWGLPDPCYEAPQSIGDRQIELVRRMTMLGAQSRQFFIDLAAEFGSGAGYPITITEYRTFVVGMDRCGDNRVTGNGSAREWDDPDINYNAYWNRPVLNPRGVPVANGEQSEWPYYGLGPDANRFYWSIHVGEASLTWFRVTRSTTGVDPHLRIGIADDLECLINRWKPAHTQIVFDYSGLTTGGDMAGTP